MDTIQLSDNTRLTKARKIKNKYGKYFLGESAIQASLLCRELPWNYVHPNSTYNTAPPFSAEVERFSPFRHFDDVRRYEYSDCVIETSFKRTDNTNSDEKYLIASHECKTAVTALRLVDPAPIRAFGPAQYRHHPSMPGGSIGFGINNDEIMGGKTEGNQLLRISRSSASLFRKMFSQLNKDLPEPLKIAIKRLNLSFTRGNSEDQFIDAMVGLEALYLPSGTNGELKFRLSLRVAIHQDDNPDERVEKYECVNDLYKTRSKLIHGSIRSLRDATSRSKFSDEQTLLNYARNILRIGCMKMLMDEDSISNWHEFKKNLDTSLLRK